MLAMVIAMGTADCERLHPGWLAQPANAVSSLAYITVGLWLLWRARRLGGGAGSRGLAATAAAMVAVGFGSFAYHGPQPGWASVVHDGAIAGLIVVFLGQSIRLLGGANTRPLFVGAWRPAAVWMLPALAVYAAGRTGSPLCHPATLWQAHAVWHGLSAVGLGIAALRCAALPEPRR
jgi:hypothetical protein